MSALADASWQHLIAALATIGALSALAAVGVLTGQEALGPIVAVGSFAAGITGANLASTPTPSEPPAPVATSQSPSAPVAVPPAA